MPATKTVIMAAQITGTRNGEDWPAPGKEIELPEGEANDLVRSGLAIDPDDVETATVPVVAETATTDGRRPLKAGPAGEGLDTATIADSKYPTGPHEDTPPIDGTGIPADAPGDSEAPAGNASREVWAAYAVEQGADAADVADMSRDQLRETYGA